MYGPGNISVSGQNKAQCLFDFRAGQLFPFKCGGLLRNSASPAQKIILSTHPLVLIRLSVVGLCNREGPLLHGLLVFS